jgi:N-acetylmuramoyl-L-alanine amidase
MSAAQADHAIKVAIDIGHSKARQGATSARGKPEFEFNRELGFEIAGTFRQQGIPYLLIGDDGLSVQLETRTAKAASVHASFYLSVHHDSAQVQFLETWQWVGVPQRFSDRFAGFSIFVSRKNIQFDRSLLCAKGIGQALLDKGFKPSWHHAELIQGEGREWADQATGVYYFDDLIVLKTATMPAVLLEAGVIINRDEELKLQEDVMRKKMASSIAAALQACMAQF